MSNSLTAEWCKTVLQEAVATFGKPGIDNADQGTQPLFGNEKRPLESDLLNRLKPKCTGLEISRTTF